MRQPHPPQVAREDEKMKALRNLFLAILLGAGFTSLASAQSYRWDDHDINRTELRNFDGFLDAHPAIDRELSLNPGLAQNREYLARHPELREFIACHPGVREELRENPYRFVRAENRWDRWHDSRDNWRDRDSWRDRDDRR